ncbi:MAG: hypothetical protein R3D80_21360 [Paracoccaceae bacterium]
MGRARKGGGDLAAEQALADAQLVLDGLEEGADGYEAAAAAVDAARADLDKLTA